MTLAITLTIPAMAATMITLPTAPKADIIVDGIKDDGYGDFYTLDSYKGDGKGATGKIASAWNDTGIFYYIEVYDTTPFHDNDNTWARDRVEFFIDWNSAADETHVDSANPYWQIGIASAPSTDGLQIEGSGNYSAFGGDINKTNYVVKPLVGNDLNGGYIIEVCFDIASTGGKAKPLAEGGSVIVDFQIADNQLGEGRSSQVFLEGNDPDADNQWQWPYACRGILPLGAAKPAPTTEAAAPVDAAAPVTVAPVVAAPVTTAPTTGDNTIAIFAVMILAAAGAVVFRKKLLL